MFRQKKRMTGLFATLFVVSSLLAPITAKAQSDAPAALTYKDFASLLPASFKPKSRAPRGFCVWSFEPAAKDQDHRLEIYNTSQNSQFDDQTRQILLPLLTGKTFVKTASWYVRFDQSGTILPQEKIDDVEYGPFMTDLQKKIKENWAPPKQDENRHTQVCFTINYDGSFKNVKLGNPSGIEDYDKACLAAVLAADKIMPLPAGAPDSVDIQFTLDYNIKSPPPVARPAFTNNVLINALWLEAMNNQMQKVKEETKDEKIDISPKETVKH